MSVVKISFESDGKVVTDSAATVLSTWTGSTNITTVGTVSTGVWNGTDIGVAYGGTGVSSLTAHGVVLGNGTSAVNVTGAGTAGQYLVSGGASADPDWASVNLVEVTAAAPAGTNSAAGVMMGLALYITTGAKTSGIIQVVVSGAVTNNTAISGWKYQIRYGTGTAPTNGAALAGTAVGILTGGTLGTGASRATMPMAIVAKISGLAASTTYWIDLSLGIVTGGTASLTTVCINAQEL